MSKCQVGQVVSVDGEKVTIVKVEKASAKCEFADKKVRTVPFAMFDGGVGDDELAGAIDEGAKKAATASKKRAPADKAVPAAAAKKSTPEPKKEEAKSRKRPTPPAYVPDNEVTSSIGPAPVEGGVEKKKYETRDDDITGFLSGFDSAAKMVKGVKGHPSKAFLNKEALTRLEGQIGEIGLGLVRMRLGNMLRCSIKKMKESPKK